MGQTVKIIGVKKQPSKNDAAKIGTTLYYSQEFDDYSVSNASHLAGLMTGSEFTYADLPDCKPGDEVELTYSKGFQDKAYLSGLTVVKPASSGK